MVESFVSKYFWERYYDYLNRGYGKDSVSMAHEAVVEWQNSAVNKTIR